MSERWWAMASSRGTALSIASSSPSTSSTRAFRLRPSCHVGSIDPPETGPDRGPNRHSNPASPDADPTLYSRDRRRFMGTGAKIAIGCGCVVLLGAAAVIGVLGAGAWWAKGKIQEASVGLDKMTAATEEIERFEKQANANAYTAPADGVIREARFLKSMDTRKQVYAVYEQHEAELRELQQKA